MIFRGRYRAHKIKLSFCGGKLALGIFLRHNQATVRPPYLRLCLFYRNTIYVYLFSIIRQESCMFCLIYCHLVENTVVSKRNKVDKKIVSYKKNK